MSASKFKRDNQIPKEENIRDYLDREQNELLSEAEGFDCALIHMGINDYYERKDRVTNFVGKMTGSLEVAA